MLPSDLTLAVTLALNFKGKYGIHYFRPKMVRLPRNKKQTYRLNCKPQMLPSDSDLAVTLTLNFQGQLWNLLYFGQKWSDCQETKGKHIYWTLCLKCDHRVWPWPWTLTMNFQGQIWNLLYLSRRWFDCHKMKSKHIEWTEGLNNNKIWPWKVRCKDLPDSNRGDFRCWRAVDSFSLLRYQCFIHEHWNLLAVCFLCLIVLPYWQEGEMQGILNAWAQFQKWLDHHHVKMLDHSRWPITWLEALDPINEYHKGSDRGVSARNM